MRKKAHLSNSKLIFQILKWTILIVMSLLLIVPILILVNASLKTLVEFQESPNSIFRLKPITELIYNYKEAFAVLSVVKRFIYTVGMTTLSAIISCIIVILVAFPVARRYFRGYNKVTTFIIASMFFPGSLVANIWLVRFLHLYNSPLVLIMFWGFGGLSVYIFMAIRFVSDLPKELDEAAFIDGCSFFAYIFRVVIPLTKPILVTIFILKFVGAWNDFLTPYIYLIDDQYMTLSTGLFNYKGQYSSNWPGLSAATVLIAFPVVTLYAFMQKYIVDGMTDGAIKG